MLKRLGPILYARSDDDRHWSFEVGVLLSESDPSQPPPCDVIADGGQVSGPRCAGHFPDSEGSVFWCWRVRLPRKAAESTARYRLRPRGDALVIGVDADESYEVVVPARGQLPRLLMYSCNGFSEPKYLQQEKDPYLPWRRVLSLHDEAVKNPTKDLRGGYHLMVGGGDQIYADSLWLTHPQMETLNHVPRGHRPFWIPPPDFAANVLRAFVDLYVLRWGQPEFARALARIPGIYTWDDHEIFDGWGSYPDDLLGCKAYQAIYQAARKTFEVLQVSGDDAPQRVRDRSHFLQALTFENDDAIFDLLLLDLRSDRTLAQVLSPQQWQDLDAWLGERSFTGGKRRHLLVVSSIPLAHLRFAALIEALGSVAELEDDLRDQWESPTHRGERAHLVMTLFIHASVSKSQVTVFSGDVHVGAHGRFSSRNPLHAPVLGYEAYIEQLTSSGILHPPPSGFEIAAMKAASVPGQVEEVDPFVTARLLPVDGARDLLTQRNWLVVDFTDSAAQGTLPAATNLWAKWWTETRSIDQQVCAPAFDPPGG